MKTALIVSGGWDGHKPKEFAQRLGDQLAKRDFKVEQATSLDALTQDLSKFGVVIPNWTMDKLPEEASRNLCGSVAEGKTNVAGIHGGAGDAFRGDLSYEWMIGGHFVGHPHVGDYTVEIVKDHAVTKGLPKSFPYKSEEYYLMVDPAIDVLAEASYTHEGKTCKMPIAWTKNWGKGRVFYSSLGHDPKEFDDFPASLQLAIQGLCWAAGEL